MFYTPKNGNKDITTLVNGILNIGSDVWIGANAIITPSCKKIGNGSVIGAGSIVTKDVPDYAIVAGNPAKIIRYRFDATKISTMLTEKWWLKND